MRTWLAIASCLLVAAGAGAQELPFRTWTVRDGLIQSRVNAIQRDSHGYLWFATWEGASRFDGRRFVNYGSHEGLPNPLVWCVAEGPDGTIWLGTHGGGIARVADTGVTLLADPIGPRNPATNVFELAFDRDGRMWAATNRGLYASASSRPTDLRFEHLEELGPAWFGRSFVDERGELWFVAADELVRCRGGAIARWPIPSADPLSAPGELRAVTPRRAGGAWVAHLRSLHVLDLPRDDGTPPTRRAEPIDFGASTSLFDVCEDDLGRLWVATSSGLVRVDAVGTRRITAAQGLPDDWIHALTSDALGGMWIGSHQGGVSFLPDSGVEHYTAGLGLGDGHAVQLFALDADRWLVATEVAGLFEIAGGRARRIEASDAPPFDRIQHNLARDADGDWWIGTGVGVHRVRGPVLDLARAEIQGAAQGLSSATQFVLGPDGSSRVLVSSDDGRVFERARGADRFEPLPFSLPEGAKDLAFASDGTLWLSEGKQLWRARDARLEEIHPWPDSNAAILPRVLHFDSRGWLWMGTRFGGVAFTREPAATNPRFERITTHDGLASDAVFALAEDRDGSMYVGTGRGVQRFRPEDRTLETIGADHEFAGEWINDLALDARGDLWIAAVNGVSHVPAGISRAQGPAPRVRFTRCVVAGAEIALPAAGAFEVPAIEIGARDSRLAFEYVAVDPIRGERLLYQTRLEGLDDAWSEPSRDLSARYGQLAAGSYRFAVRCLDPSGGATGAEISSLRIEVVPPTWTRPWFLALALLAVLALGFAAHRMRLRRELLLERMRTQIASDLHDDIGAGLAQIAISSELARRAPASDAQDVMGEVAQVARDLRASMSDLVWSVDPRNDSLADVVGRMRHFAGDVIAGDGRELDFQAPEESELARISLAPDRRRHLFLFFKEAVTNAARHARAPHVRIELALDAGRLRLSVLDDGTGFDPSAQHAGRGLKNLRSRAHELGAQLAIDSTPARGTRITLDTRV